MTIKGTNNADILLGTPNNDQIVALGGNDTIIGTTGSDTIDGGNGIDTVDYSSFSQKITLLTQGFLDNGASSNSQLIKIEEIIAPIGQANEINAASATGSVSISVNLENQTVTANNIPGLGSQTFTVENFVNVKGTKQSDKIIGDSNNNQLFGFKGDDAITGNGGNDTVNGGQGRDTLAGTDGVSQGAGERDVLRGSSEQDFFILGDENGAFYQTKGNKDLAVISDFSFGEQIQLGANETYDIKNDSSSFKIFLTSDSQNELIADVKINTSSIPALASANSAKESITSSDFLLTGVPEGEFTISSGETIGNIFVGA